ncbi:hypothetical protein QMT40_003574 [Parvibaculaceae bacterium PLY_AMNH_Bact1]|nr:hypothetical protein QMT40_003574 [Parvibaculaceae bacterium PLY_AMNH_Bact1]
MNIFRGYTDGLSASYQVATYQSGSFKRRSPKAAPLRPARNSFVKAVTALATSSLKGALKGTQKLLKRRGKPIAPSDFSAQLDLFMRPAAPQTS